MKVKVDKDLCIACGLCVNACPDVFDWDDDGMAIAKQGDVSPENEGCAHEAVEGCPTEAIKEE